MKLTRANLLCWFLESHGWNEVPSRSRKYRCFRKDGWSHYYFVGKAGALRKGKCSSRSVAVGMNYPTQTLRTLYFAEHN